VDDVDEVVHHAALAAHDQVEVAQADVEVDDRDLLAAAGDAGGDAGAAGGLAHAALARGDYDDFRQVGFLRFLAVIPAKAGIQLLFCETGQARPVSRTISPAPRA
jgi:hypothetical protein